MRAESHQVLTPDGSIEARENTGFRARLALLRRLPPAQRLPALAALMDAASESELPPVLIELLELAAPGDAGGPGFISRSVGRRLGERGRRISDAALVNLARGWETIPQELKGAAQSVGAGRWAALASQLAQDADPRGRRSLAILCKDTADPELAGALVGLLADPDLGTGSGAEQALLGLAFAVAGMDARSGEECADGEIPGRAWRLVEEAVAGAAMSVSEHRRRGPILAAMAMLGPAHLWRERGDRAGVLTTWFSRADSEAQSALRAAVRLSPHPLARRRALEWLGIAALSGACADRLARARTPEEHQVVLQRSHLLVNPVRAGAMRAVDFKAASPGNAGASGGRAETTLPDARTLASLTVAARRGLARFVECLNIGIEHRRSLLEPLLSDEDALARLGSVSGNTAAGLLDLCFDRNARVARAAFHSWSLIGERGVGGGFERRLGLHDEPGRRRMLARLARSPHAPVRRLAAQEAEFIECLDPSSPASRACARWLLLRDPGLLERRVREAMASADQDARVRAVQLVRHLGWCERLEPELLAIVESPRAPADRATATAVAALGVLQTPSSIAIVQRHLGDPDGRIRANAVEALARQSRHHADLASAAPSAYHVLIELKHDSDHRVRANALRALLSRPAGAIESKPGFGPPRVYEPEAVASLAEMLADARPAHRLAAAWLAGRVLPLTGRARLGKRFAELAARVGDAAAGDEDEHVRRRARQCVETLRTELRTAWSGRARERAKSMSGAAS